MEAEQALSSLFEADAVRMRPRPLDLASILAAGRRRRLVRRLGTAAAAACCIGVIGFVGVQVLTDARPFGRTIPPAAQTDFAALELQASDALKGWVSDLVAADDSASWDALSERARDVVGSFDSWGAERRELASFLNWVAAPDVEVVLTRIPATSGDRYVATAVAPVEAEAALLQPVPLVRAGGRFLVDLNGQELAREVSLEPITPVFNAGSCSAAGECEAPQPPRIEPGMTFSATLDPATAVRKAWYSIGSEWTAEAFPLSSRGLVNEYATFEPGDMEPGVKVFLVTIETRDGALVNYGYRVVYEG